MRAVGSGSDRAVRRYDGTWATQSDICLEDFILYGGFWPAAGGSRAARARPQGRGAVRIGQTDLDTHEGMVHRQFLSTHVPGVEDVLPWGEQVEFLVLPIPDTPSGKKPFYLHYFRL